ncbi:DegT/DnrJ/EryC1/StrS family aminotransferase [Ghiorsea bivora]|uniref:DegT/DnrJ/EryC1/StrS family aminotransferase n=1 Tax=Ghiorsea bivora TaxID=1485545 RepID=UPI000570BCEA|nr:DegT/DnrJ/EryC1/StrS family aminotransferase [Ghiorsea bivora]
MPGIPHSRPSFGKPFAQAAQQVIQSGFLAQGDVTTALTQTLQTQLSGQAVLAVDSGTSALMLAIRALSKDKKQARVGIPAYACASLLFAVKNADAKPVFMDCTTNLTLDAEQAHTTAKDLDILVLVHPFGMIEPLVSEPFDCPVIEDIAQSAGAMWQGKAVGTFADVCIGSFYATKPWGGAYGGFISSKDEALIQSITKMTNPDQADLQQDYVGHHQLSNIHAALAQVRLSHAAAEQQQRQTWVNKYDAMLKNYAVTPITGIQGNHFRYIIRSEHTAENVIQTLQQQGITAMRPVQQPLHHAIRDANCPQADKAWQYCVSLPLLHNMNEQEFLLLSQGLATCFKS